MWTMNLQSTYDESLMNDDLVHRINKKFIWINVLIFFALFLQFPKISWTVQKLSLIILITGKCVYTGCPEYL